MLCDIVPVLYQNRYCYQKDIDVALCVKNRLSDYVSRLFKVTGSNPTVSESIPLLERKRSFKKVDNYSEIFVVAGNIPVNFYYEKKYRFDCVDIYSKKSNKWTSTKMPDKRLNYCVCSFMQNLFIISGYNINNMKQLRTCMKYDVGCKRWSYISNLIVERNSAGCTVFGGNIVVTGGYKKMLD